MLSCKAQQPVAHYRSANKYQQRYRTYYTHYNHCGSFKGDKLILCGDILYQRTPFFQLGNTWLPFAKELDDHFPVIIIDLQRCDRAIF